MTLNRSIMFMVEHKIITLKGPLLELITFMELEIQIGLSYLEEMGINQLLSLAIQMLFMPSGKGEI